MADKEKNFVSAVIYVHNAEDRAGDFLRAVIQILEENFEHSEIICVNDASDDNSLNVIKDAGKAAVNTSVSVVNMSNYYGLELAMNAGTDISIGDFVFEFDNTVLDFDLSVIMEIYRHSLKGYDIVSASADRKERFASQVFYTVFEKYSALSCKMSTESFRVLSRRVINRVSSMNRTVPYRKAAYETCGLKTEHLKYSVLHQAESRFDRQEKRYRFGLAVDVLILFTQVGYRFSVFMTVLMMLMSVFMTVYSIVIYAASNPAAGWTTTILFLSVAFFGMFGIMTLVLKYLQLLVDLVFKRKQYSFESIEKLMQDGG